MAQRHTAQDPAARLFGLNLAASCGLGRFAACLVAACWAAASLAAGKPAIVVSPSLQAQAPSEIDIGIRVDDAESAPPASVFLISGLPADITFSAGRSVVRGTWEVPLAAIAGLKVKIPAEVKGRSDLVILLTHNSEKYTVVLASARTALVVDTAPTRSESVAANQADEARLAQDARKAEEVRKAEEARKQAEAARKAEKERHIAEAKRAEEARLAEAASKAEEARKAKEARKQAEAARKAEEERRVAEAKRAEEARLAEEARKAEEARLAKEARKTEEARKAEEVRKQAERPAPEVKTADASSAVAALDQARKPMEPAPSSSQTRLENFVAQGDRHLADGNVVIARQYYLRAAQSGMARAALRLAETYDPNELRRLNVQGLMPDIAEAKRWYAQAIALGEAGAQIKFGRPEGK
jgi:hypothetical protein